MDCSSWPAEALETYFLGGKIDEVTISLAWMFRWTDGWMNGLRQVYIVSVGGSLCCYKRLCNFHNIREPEIFQSMPFDSDNHSKDNRISNYSEPYLNPVLTML